MTSTKRFLCPYKKQIVDSLGLTYDDISYFRMYRTKGVTKYCKIGPGLSMDIAILKRPEPIPNALEVEYRLRQLFPDIKIRDIRVRQGNHCRMMLTHISISLHGLDLIKQIKE